jgi:hypothetical protein
MSPNILYKTVTISIWKRLLESGKLPPSPNWQLDQIDFREEDVTILMKDGSRFELKAGQWEATDNALGTAGSYYIKITSRNPLAEITIYGSDGELPEASWQDIKLRLKCKNRLGLMM